MNRVIRRGIPVLALVTVLAVTGAWLLAGGTREDASFRIVAVTRGDLLATISATGTVEPEELVDVGAQVAGKIVSFGTDMAGKMVDYGSMVEEGTILAQIDDALYAADAAQAKAQLEQAKAGVARAEADLGQLQAKLVQAERDWHRARKLGPGDALSQSDYDAALSASEVARANVAVGKAAIAQAASSLAQAAATLRRAQQNLDYCTIKSPVRGVIIDRRVNIGQTVVASLNAPSLFLIAKDLRRLQVWVAVNEADVGSIHPGQPVTFTVDAFPGRVFQGEVGKMRLNATMTQNVVTYTVEVLTDNQDGKLLPYLTANVKFIVSNRPGVLLVPNAALRWTPTAAQMVPGGAGKARRPASEQGAPSAGGPARTGSEEANTGTLWTPEGKLVKAIPVRLGMTDGTVTEIENEQLKEGTVVVIGDQPREAANPSTAASPFTPQLFRSGGGRH